MATPAPVKTVAARLKVSLQQRMAAAPPGPLTALQQARRDQQATIEAAMEFLHPALAYDWYVNGGDIAQVIQGLWAILRRIIVLPPPPDAELLAAANDQTILTTKQQEIFNQPKPDNANLMTWMAKVANDWNEYLKQVTDAKYALTEITVYAALQTEAMSYLGRIIAHGKAWKDKCGDPFGDVLPYTYEHWPLHQQEFPLLGETGFEGLAMPNAQTVTERMNSDGRHVQGLWRNAITAEKLEKLVLLYASGKRREVKEMARAEAAENVEEAWQKEALESGAAMFNDRGELVEVSVDGDDEELAGGGGGAAAAPGGAAQAASGSG